MVHLAGAIECTLPSGNLGKMSPLVDTVPARTPLGIQMPEQETTCPDCQSEMRPIKLISTGEFSSQKEVGYAVGDAEKTWFLGRYPKQGKVRAEMCRSCGRITLHGEAH